jgi:aryl-alcohol dehydrogenase-like predicted oxidoreductase
MTHAGKILLLVLTIFFLGGNHRKSLVENLDASLKRLNLSYVDILYVHAYEYRTPIEEIMRSLDDVVRSGKVSNSWFTTLRYSN